MLVINGKSEAEGAGTTLAEMLEARGYKAERVAVERNGVIVPKAEFSKTMLEEGDVLEIVGFVGGG